MSQTTCDRCGKPCQGSKTQKPEARIYRKAMKGQCIICLTVTILQSLANMYGPDTFPDLPNCLRLPHVQEQFAAVMRAGKSEALPDEIDWEAVIANWNVGEKPKGGLF